MVSLLYKNFKKNWKILFETYLYDEFFYNFLSGRNFNYNKNDESFIGKSKSISEIKTFIKKNNKTEFLKKSKKFRILINIKGLLVIKEIKKIYPNSKYIIVVRDLFDISNSIYYKKWFTNKNIKKDLQFPNVIYKKKVIPYWVPKNNREKWLKYSLIDRSYFYTLLQYQSFLRFYKLNYKNIFLIKYNQLCSDPLKVSCEISDFLNIKFGQMTNKIINSIKEKNIKKKRTNRFVLKKKIKDLNNKLKKLK